MIKDKSHLLMYYVMLNGELTDTIEAADAHDAYKQLFRKHGAGTQNRLFVAVGKHDEEKKAYINDADASLAP